MGLHEWAFGGIYLSPLFGYALMALVITGGLRWLLQITPIGRWIWHEALFDCGLFVLVLAAITWLWAQPV